MSTQPFSYFKQGDNEYEVVDRYARNAIASSRKYLFLGDSYALGMPANNTNWVQRVVSNLGLSSSDYVAATAADLQLGSFWPTTSTHKSWVDSIQTIRNRITNQLANEITDIVVAGGYNETFSPNHTDDEITTPMEQFATYCKTAFPNAKLWLGFIGYNVLPTAAGADIRNDFNSRVWKVYNRASHYGFKVMSGVDHHLWYNSETIGDGIHPIDSLLELIGDAITANLLGCDFEAVYEHVSDFTMFNESDFTGVGSVEMTSHTATCKRMRNDLAIISPENKIAFRNVTMPATGNFIQIGTLNNKLPINQAIYLAKGVFTLYNPTTATMSEYLGVVALAPSGNVLLKLNGLLYGSEVAQGTTVWLTCMTTIQVVDHAYI